MARVIRTLYRSLAKGSTDFEKYFEKGRHVLSTELELAPFVPFFNSDSEEPLKVEGFAQRCRRQFRSMAALPESVVSVRRLAFCLLFH